MGGNEARILKIKTTKVGLILCALKDEAVARCVLEGLPDNVMADVYRTVMPEKKALADEIKQTQEFLRQREALSLTPPRSEARRLLMGRRI